MPLGPRTVIGRNPLARPDEETVSLRDQSQLLSRNHVRLEVDADGTAWARDLHSTNGTMLDDRRLRPGRRTLLTPASVLRISDRQLSIERSAADAAPR